MRLIEFASAEARFAVRSRSCGCVSFAHSGTFGRHCQIGCRERGSLAAVDALARFRCGGMLVVCPVGMTWRAGRLARCVARRSASALRFPSALA